MSSHLFTYCLGQVHFLRGRLVLSQSPVVSWVSTSILPAGGRALGLGSCSFCSRLLHSFLNCLKVAGYINQNIHHSFQSIQVRGLTLHTLTKILIQHLRGKYMHLLLACRLRMKLPQLFFLYHSEHGRIKCRREKN